MSRADDVNDVMLKFKMLVFCMKYIYNIYIYGCMSNKSNMCCIHVCACMFVYMYVYVYISCAIYIKSLNC